MGLVIFDFDGTLYDSEDAVWKTVSYQKRFVPELAVIRTRQDLRDIYRGNFYEEVCRWNMMPIKEASALDKRMHACFPPHYSAPLVKGIKPALRQLAGRHRLAVISSNYKAPMLSLMRRDGIADHFSAVSGADSGKPKTARVRGLLRRFNVHASQALYVTDTTGDVKEAAKVGLRSIGVSWGFHTVPMLKDVAARMARRPAQLPKLVGDILG